MIRKVVNEFFVLLNVIRFRCLGITFGSSLRVFRKLYIDKSPSARIVIGDSFTFASGSGINPITANTCGYLRLDDGATLMIGNNSGLSSTTIWIKDSLRIGNHVLIGGGSLIMDNDCHSLDYRIRNGCILDDLGYSIDGKMAGRAPIVIEDDVLIGAKCIILKGVTIGARSIIGAGSVVTKSIPSDCIAAGNPCQVVRKINQ